LFWAGFRDFCASEVKKLLTTITTKTGNSPKRQEDLFCGIPIRVGGLVESRLAL
jgi:hypothetical protein